MLCKKRGACRFLDALLDFLHFSIKRILAKIVILAFFWQYFLQNKIWILSKILFCKKHLTDSRNRGILYESHRGVAQFGRALRSGRRGRKFESCHLDHRKCTQFREVSRCCVFCFIWGNPQICTPFVRRHFKSTRKSRTEYNKKPPPKAVLRGGFHFMPARCLSMS